MADHNPVETGTVYFFRADSVSSWDSLYANNETFLVVEKSYDTGAEAFDLTEDYRALVAFDLTGVDLGSVASARLRFSLNIIYYEGNPYSGHALATPDVAFTVVPVTGLPLGTSYHPGPGEPEAHDALESMATYFLSLYPDATAFSTRYGDPDVADVFEIDLPVEALTSGLLAVRVAIVNEDANDGGAGDPENPLEEAADIWIWPAGSEHAPVLILEGGLAESCPSCGPGTTGLQLDFITHHGAAYGHHGSNNWGLGSFEWRSYLTYDPETFDGASFGEAGFDLHTVIYFDTSGVGAEDTIVSACLELLLGSLADPKDEDAPANILFHGHWITGPALDPNTDDPDDIRTYGDAAFDPIPYETLYASRESQVAIPLTVPPPGDVVGIVFFNTQDTILNDKHVMHTVVQTGIQTPRLYLCIEGEGGGPGDEPVLLSGEIGLVLGLSGALSVAEFAALYLTPMIRVALTGPAFDVGSLVSRRRAGDDRVSRERQTDHIAKRLRDSAG